MLRSLPCFSRLLLNRVIIVASFKKQLVSPQYKYLSAGLGIWWRHIYSKSSFPLLRPGVHFSFDVLTSWADQGSCAHKCIYVKIFRTVTRNAVNKGVWREKNCYWPPLNKYAMNKWLSSLRIRAHLSWRTGKHLHVLPVLRTYSTCSYPGYQDTTTYAALP